MGIKYAPASDNRHNQTTVWDTAGAPHTHTFTNARELVRHARWTLDPREAEKRRGGATVEPVVFVNDGSSTKSTETTQPPTPPEPFVPEDLSVISKDILRKAAQYLKIPNIDGRSSEKRFVAEIEGALDARLAASGDFDGSVASDDANNDVAVDARRRRAFELAALTAGIKFTPETSLAQAVGSIASLVEDASVRE